MSVISVIRNVIVDGIVPAGPEKIGTITGADGKRHRVLERSERNINEEIFVINTTGTIPIPCTSHQRLMVLKPYRSGKTIYKPNFKPFHKGQIAYNKSLEPSLVEPENATVGDYLMYPIPTRTVAPSSRQELPYYSTHKNAKHINRYIYDSSDVAWMMGFFVADGSANKQGIHITLSPADDINRLRRAINSIGLDTRELDVDGRYVIVHANSRSVGESFRIWFGACSAEKHFPEFIFDGWDTDNALQGLLEGDGYVSKRSRWVLSTVSLTLAMQARRMSLLAGWNPVLKKFIRHSGHKNAAQMYQVSGVKSKQYHTFKWRNYYCMPIKSVERVMYDGAIVDMNIDDSEFCVVNGAIVQ